MNNQQTYPQISGEEYHYRFARYLRAISGVVDQRIKLHALFPPIRWILYDTGELERVERDEIKELDAYLQKIIDDAFQDIVLS